MIGWLLCLFGFHDTKNVGSHFAGKVLGWGKFCQRCGVWVKGK